MGAIIYQRNGTSKADDLITYYSDEYVRGFGGNDHIVDGFLFASNDVMCGNAGNDLIESFDGSDKLMGGKGDDRIVVNSRDEIVVAFGGAGDDTLLIRGDGENIEYHGFEHVEWIT